MRPTRRRLRSIWKYQDEIKRRGMKNGDKKMMMMMMMTDDEDEEEGRAQ